MKNERKIIESDVVLIGAGIMSATLGCLLNELDKNISITIFERLETAALESSESNSNAGTGHAGFCELNYTPELDNGLIDISKAVKINEQFFESLQFWSWLVSNKYINSDFINIVPHMSFVKGNENVEFLRKRYDEMKKCHLFYDIKYTENIEEIKKWFPLIKNYKKLYPVAATRVERGTDIDFGKLTKYLINHVVKNGVVANFNHEVLDLKKKGDFWITKVKNLITGDIIKMKSKYVFIGAGGFALTLLEKADIKEAKGYGGFPISGQWLVCKNKEVIEKHHVKVYGKAAEGTPPMSVPHLDTRIINGEKCLLFGPFAGFTTKFLKNGSATDLIKSIKPDNILPMTIAAAKNLGLTKYLIKEVLKSYEEKFQTLIDFYPGAIIEDWEIAVAGQRVQIIKEDKKEGGKIEFGTEVIVSEDGTISALLGASPGASTSVAIMLDLIEKCFSDKMDIYSQKIEQMIPSYKKSLNEERMLFYKIDTQTSSVLNLI